MKNKKATYILVVLTAIVWGLVVKKIVLHLKDETIEDDSRSRLFNDSAVPFYKQEKPRLMLDYNDPFLKFQPDLSKVQQGTNNQSGRNQLSLRKRIPLPKESNKNQVRWPDIKFSGTILNDKTNKEVALVNINGEDFLMREKDAFEEITLESCFTDSIIVTYKKETRTILKKIK